MPRSPPTPPRPAHVQFGIGALSGATGVPAATLRTWERRYGFPVAARTSGGQRAYPPEAVEQVLLAARAMELGHRPAVVLRASMDELERLVVAGGGSPRASAVQPAPPRVPRAVAALDGAAQEAEFRREVASEGLWAFLVNRVVPLLTEVGDACVQGRLSIYEEHLFSERLREFLAASWRPIADRNEGPVGVCATLPGERHALGLHLVACTLAIEGWRVVFVGTDLPVSEIAESVRSADAAAVFLSVSAAGRAGAEASLGPLRAALAPEVALLTGGAGAPVRSSATRVASLEALREWLAAPR